MSASEAKKIRMFLGECKYCRNPARPGLETCQDCADVVAEVSRKWYTRRVIAGICTRCGGRPAKFGRKQCSSCLKKGSEVVLESYRKNRDSARLTMKERYHQLQSLRLCTCCGNEPLKEGSMHLGEICYKRKRDKLKDKKKS